MVVVIAIAIPHLQGMLWHTVVLVLLLLLLLVLVQVQTIKNFI